MSEERIKQLESDIEAIREALYKNNLMARPIPKSVAHSVADASSVVIRTTYGSVPGVDLGVDLSFEYLCECSLKHQITLRRVKGLRYGTVRTHTATCSNGVAMQIHIRIPDDEAKQSVTEAMKDYSA